MRVKPLRLRLEKYCKSHGLTKKLKKQIQIFTTNIRHPSLNTEILEPKHLRLYSFRIDRKYRAVFVMLSQEEVEIIDINDHYQ